MTMKSKITKTSAQNTQALRIKKEEGKSEIRMITESQLSPAVLNALTIKGISHLFSDDGDLTEAVKVMKEKSEKIIAGDLSELESTPYTQVACLNSIFSAMTLRSAANLGNSIKLTEAYMRLALKSTSPMRAHRRDTGNDQESADCVCQTSQYCPRTPADQ